jgi:hypothetical protein
VGRRKPASAPMLLGSKGVGINGSARIASGTSKSSDAPARVVPSSGRAFLEARRSVLLGPAGQPGEELDADRVTLPVQINC